MTTTETVLVSVAEDRFVDRSTGQILATTAATPEQLRDFAIQSRAAIPHLNEDKLYELEAVLVGVAKRLRQLGLHAVQAEAARAMAIRRIGELIGPGKQDLSTPQYYELLPNGNAGQELSPTDRKRRHEARLLAEFGDTVDALIAKELAKETPSLSLAKLVRICQAKRAARDAPMTDRKFPILYADPPWQYEGAESANRQIENQYGTMSLEAIKALDVPATDDAILFLWTTSPKLVEGLDVLKAWGFQYRTCMVWIKDKIGMGYYARQQHELLLIGKRGSLPVPQPENRPPSIFHANRTSHSTKPEIVYELIEAMYPEYERESAERTCFCELFQRAPREGWYGWGMHTAVQP